MSIKIYIVLLLTITLHSCKPNSETNFANLPAKNIKDIRIRDPFVLPVENEGIYYLYLSMNDTNNQRVVGAYKSKDLETWYGPQTVFKFPDNFWGSRKIWAPEVHKYKGKYYLFSTFTGQGELEQKKPGEQPRMSPDNRGTQILVADSPEGPFKPFYNKPHTPKGWMTLDGTLWVEEGQPYLIFCREWIQMHVGTMELAPLKDDLSEISAEPKVLFQASDAKWARNMWDLGMKHNGWVTDGPFIYKTKNGKLIMIWSSFGEHKYAVGQAISESGKIAGPWTQIDKPLFAKDGGHGMLFRSFDGQLYLVIHQPNSGDERAKFFELAEVDDLLVLKNKLE